MKQAMAWAGAVAGFVAWFPAVAAGVALALRWQEDVGRGGNDVASWATRFADGVAVGVEDHFNDWRWPGEHAEEPAGASAPKPPSNPFLDTMAALGRSVSPRCGDAQSAGAASQEEGKDKR